MVQKGEGNIVPLPSSFQLETDDESGHRPYISKSKEAKEHVNFRAPEWVVRIADEISAHRTFPAFQTRTDCFVDSFYQWAKQMEAKAPLPHTKAILMELELDQQAQQKARYETLLTKIETARQQAFADRHGPSLLKLHGQCLVLRDSTFKHHAENKQIKRLDELIKDISDNLHDKKILETLLT